MVLSAFLMHAKEYLPFSTNEFSFSVLMKEFLARQYCLH